jgi:MoaA/NifB/PqqE/SkfB family radical SAM enzyme
MSDDIVGTISAQKVFGHLLSDAEHRGIPLSGTVELTNKCNLRCLHCFIRPFGGQVSYRDSELSTEQWINILSRAIDCGCLFLILTGGEILVRPDFWKIYSYIKDRGTIVQLFTNGTKITERLVEELSNRPPKAIEITLYGMTEHIYELMTQVPGSYKECMRGIELVLKYDLPLRLKTMLTTLNCNELPLMKDFAKKLNVTFRYDVEINKRLDRRGHPERLRLSPEEIVRLDLEDPPRAAEFEEMFALRSGGGGQVQDSIYSCGAGATSFHVDYRGYLSPCIISRYETCSLLDTDFAQAWYEFIPGVLKEKRTRQNECDCCEVSHACNQCHGWAKLESGDPEEPVSFQCQITRLRQKVFQKCSE